MKESIIDKIDKISSSIIFYKLFHEFSFWSIKSFNDIFKDYGPLLECDQGQQGSEAGGAGQDDDDGGDQPRWERGGAGGEQE